jgi:hypothetical protein
MYPSAQSASVQQCGFSLERGDLPPHHLNARWSQGQLGHRQSQVYQFFQQPLPNSSHIDRFDYIKGTPNGHFKSFMILVINSWRGPNQVGNSPIILYAFAFTFF